MRIENTSIANLSPKEIILNDKKPLHNSEKPSDKALDGISSRASVEAKAREFEEIFIADSLKNAKIGMADSSLVGDTKITDTFSTFMNKALAEIIVSQGGFGLTEHITQSLLQQNAKTESLNINTPKE